MTDVDKWFHIKIIGISGSRKLYTAKLLLSFHYFALIANPFNTWFWLKRHNKELTKYLLSKGPPSNAFILAWWTKSAIADDTPFDSMLVAWQLLNFCYRQKKILLILYFMFVCGIQGSLNKKHSRSYCIICNYILNIDLAITKKWLLK